jgi:tetratricopeptide (TPR) repeat protein
MPRLLLNIQLPVFLPLEQSVLCAHLPEDVALFWSPSELPPNVGVAAALNSLGDLYWDRGDLNEAESFYRRSLTSLEEVGNQQARADLYIDLGRLYMVQRNFQEAEAAFRWSLEISERLGTNMLWRMFIVILPICMS